jgi:hypothetical protein
MMYKTECGLGNACMLWCMLAGTVPGCSLESPFSWGRCMVSLPISARDRLRFHSQQRVPECEESLKVGKGYTFGLHPLRLPCKGYTPDRCTAGYTFAAYSKKLVNIEVCLKAVAC